MTENQCRAGGRVEPTGAEGLERRSAVDCGVGRVTADRGGAGGMRLPGGAVRMMASGGAEGGRIQGRAYRSKGRGGVTGPATGGGAGGSTGSDEAGDRKTRGLSTQQSFSREDERLTGTSQDEAGGLTEVCNGGKRGMQISYNTII